MIGLPLKGFKRLNEAVSPELLSDDELTKLEDAVLDEEVGRPKKRLGWNKFNSNASGGTLHSIYDVKSANNTNYLIGGYGTTVKVSSSGTGAWGSAISGLSGIAKFNLAPYDGKFYLTDGTIAPKVLGGDALADTWSLEITAPDVTLVETGHHASGNLTANTCYKWVITYVTKEGIESPPSQPITHQLSVSDIKSTDGTNKCIGFRLLPVSTDSRVNARRIYRTPTDSEVYYFHSQIDNVLTSWYDVAADTDLGSESPNYLNAPQTAKYCAIHKERLFLANQTRKVKCWTTPAHSKALTTALTIVLNGTSKTFTTGVGIRNSCGITNPGGSLSPGYYTYRLVFYDENGIMSDYIDSNEINVSAGDYVTVYGLPRVASDYKGIAGGKVYRKVTAGSGGAGTFYYIADYVPGTPISDRGNLTDTAYVATATAWATNQTTDTERTGIAYSDIAKPPTFILEDIRDVYPDDGDQITGIFDDRDGVLVFKENSICKIFTNGSSANWTLMKLVHDIGALENTIAKVGSQYYFVSPDKNVYSFNSQSGTENTGWYIKDSLDSVTTFHSSTTDDSWYVLGVSGGGLTSSYGFLVYDLFLKTWYRFNVSAIPYSCAIKKHGSSAGELLITNGQYVMYYNGSIDDGTVDIVPIIRTKTFGDGVSLNRLRRLWFNYKKVDDKTMAITVVNPDTAVTNTHSDTTNSTNASDWKLYDDPIGDSDSLKETSKFYIQVTGAGFSEWGDMRLDMRPIHRGKQVGS